MTLARLARGPVARGALVAVTLGALGADLPARAQDAGLPLLSLDLSQRLQTGSGSTGATGAVTSLAFSLRDATPTETLSLTARSAIRFDDDPSRGVLDGPQLSFGYDRKAPGASLSVAATARRDEVDDLADLSAFVGEDGVIVLPPDFQALAGTGTRQELSADVALALRQDRPLGVTFNAGVTDLTYQDVSSPDLQDSRRLRLGAGLTFALGGGRTASASLRYQALDEDGSPLSETFGLDLGASAERPRGPISASLSFDRTDAGTRASARLGRTLSFPTGSLAGSLGLARGEDGELSPTASLDYRRQGPDGGTFALSLAEGLRAGDDDQEERTTTLSARYDRALTPRARLSLDALYAATDPTGAGAASSEAEVGAAMRYALTPAWSLDAGLRGSASEDANGRETGATAFLGVSRSFTGTF